MTAFTRAMAPIVALALGTWVGLGRPDATTAIAAGRRAAAVVPCARSLAAPRNEAVNVPLPEATPLVDSAALPEPPPLWPQLNPEDTVQRAWLVSEGPWHGPRDGRRLVTFTFDDGPGPDTDPALLHVLSEHGIRAAFFVIGGYLVGTSRRSAEARDWARQIKEAGHFVGNHTFDHRRLTAISHRAALAEIDDSAAAIEEAVGQRPSLFRPPYGVLDASLEAAIQQRGLELLLWNIDVEDMKRDDPDEILQSLQDQLIYKEGGIVLLHDVHAPSVRAFAKLVRWLESSKWDPERPEKPGWDVVDLPAYLRATLASPQPYPSRDSLLRARREWHERKAQQLAGDLDQLSVSPSQTAAALPISLLPSILTAQ